MAETAIEHRVIFMGTPQFAVPSLRALAGGPYMLTVVTQPDRPAGRGGKLTPPPVKVAAEELGLPLMQPVSLRDPDFRQEMAELRPEVTVLVAYGEYVPPSLLDLPRRGSVNLHPSLLPRWRGSTPIQSAILEGDLDTGVSIILMDRGLDTGPVLAQRRVPIEAEETTPQLSGRLAEVGAGLLGETLPLWLRGAIEPRPQGDEGVTLTRELKKEDGLIDWGRPAEEIARRVRAMQPWPGAHTYWQGRVFKVLRARQAEAPGAEALPPGTVATMSAAGRGKTPAVSTGNGALELIEVQLEGKPPTEARALLSGYPQIVGAVLGG
jgi:methionyl-tRNA formyltransferase